MNFNEHEVTSPVLFYAEHASIQGVSQGVFAVPGNPAHLSADRQCGWASKFGIFRVGFKRLSGQRCPECGSQNVARALGVTGKTLQCLDCRSAWDR